LNGQLGSFAISVFPIPKPFLIEFITRSNEELGAETTTEAVLPKDILDEKDLGKPPPKYTDWNKESSDSDGTEASDSSAGTIPAVKPFNLGKDPGDLKTRPST